MLRYLGNYVTINFELYKVFYFVGEYKSITKTSEYLNVSQPAITKHIKKLENILNIKLIKKTSLGIELTAEGYKLYEKIKNPINNLLKIELKYKIKIK